MTKEIKDKIIDKGVGVVITSIIGLCSFWFGSFAKGKNLTALEYRVQTIEGKSIDYAKRTDLDLVLSGLCIIDKRTCTLRKDR